MRCTGLGSHAPPGPYSPSAAPRQMAAAITRRAQRVASPGGSVSISSTKRPTCAPRQRRQAGLSGLVAKLPGDAFAHEPLLRAPGRASKPLPVVPSLLCKGTDSL